MKKLIRIVIIGIVATNFVLLTGCGTVSGMGKDIQSGGKALTKVANKDK